jgi:hypothetical protein
MSPNQSFVAAVRNVARHGDTDIFPFPFENLLFSEFEKEAVSFLETIHKDFGSWLATYPPQCISALTQVGYTGFRWAIILCKRYSAMSSYFGLNATLDFCPRFPGAGILASAEGDIGVGDCLVEVKTVKRNTSANDLRQVITYLALDAAAGRNRWKSFAFFNPRRGTLHIAEIEPFVLRVSGGRPASEVFSDLIQFVESHSLSLDTRF